MMTDPIADLLTRVQTAVKAQHRKVDVPASNLKVGIIDILKKNGFIRNYRLYRQGQKGILRVYLKYSGKNRPVIRGLKRVSKSSGRVYVPYSKLPKVLDGLGIAVVSTSSGLMSDQAAREAKVGGEVLCTIW
ncbi:MAG: 30S ribosomal protein S8 [Deltaproteobacteria bacterium]|nr:30S ribosomal protein S8 [Deltaproteobacteria bacterium]